MDSTTLITFFDTFIGEIPPEFEGLIYVFGIFVVLFVADQFFTLLSTLFGVTKWQT